MPPQQEQRGVKRKPPTFQHLPVERAKKLKRSWVEAQKIKSKWKAQKRKEGLVAPRPQLEDMVDAPEDKGEGSDDEEDEEAMSRHSDADPTSEESEDGVSEESEEGSADEMPSTSRPPTKHTRQTTAKGRAGRPQDKPEDKPTLRELQSKAYSKASLHHHKSLPLHRHKGPAVTRGRGGVRGGNNRGAPRGRGRGRGQPDMGLRMKAMLEKIKQDMT